MTLRTALLQGTRLLDDARIPAPRLTAEVLLSFALRQDRSFLYAHSTDELSEIGWIHFGRYLHQRLKGVPTQYITGRQEFYGRTFRVNPFVLIPRPETEHVVEAALARLGPGDVVLDAGTGSGAIAVTLALERPCRVLACDISADAVAVARRNAQSLRADVSFFAANLTAPLAPASIDLLVSNPPYVPLADLAGLQAEVRDYEPHLALFAGPDGMDVYRRLISEAPRVLRPGGRIVLELGYNLEERVRGLLSARFSDIRAAHDLAGIPRVLSAVLASPESSA